MNDTSSDSPSQQKVKKLTFLDKAFWLTESDNNPKHVASLQILDLPVNADKNYVKKLFTELQKLTTGVTPFNCRVQSFLGFPIKLIPLEKLDMQYHVQLHLLDDIADREALHNKAAELHEIRLDTDKPLWQFHIIESQKGNEFSLYIKIHHMLGDGATLVRWLQAAYSLEVKAEGFIPIWAIETIRKSSPKNSKNSKKITLFFKNVFVFLFATKDFIWVLVRVILKLLRINTHYMPVPFTGTKTILTGQVKKGRVVTTLDLPFDRIKALSKQLRASVNEILLCSFDIGIHRFLSELGQSFDKALFTNMPINLRRPGDTSGGNMIAIVPVELAHGEKDPYLRLRRIIENHRIVLRAAKRSRPGAFAYYTVLIQSFALIYEVLHLSNVVNPIANILISNVPGPKEVMYFKDCKLKSIYPISTITAGGGVNITLMTYNNVANVGIVCCDKEIKSLEPLAQHFKDAFELLEKSVHDYELNIDDIGEKIKNENLSDIIEENAYSK
ncbi:MAG: diacylglycerol O-acyltransferase [Polaribacter sp.]|jgi:diacylglycerol O-acyltransferase